MEKCIIHPASAQHRMRIGRTRRNNNNNNESGKSIKSVLSSGAPCFTFAFVLSTSSRCYCRRRHAMCAHGTNMYIDSLDIARTHGYCSICCNRTNDGVLCCKSTKSSPPIEPYRCVSHPFSRVYRFVSTTIGYIYYTQRARARAKK